jgi:xanthine dehydrogenase accessory factor
MPGPVDAGGDVRVVEDARRLEAAGRSFALATVVYRKPPVSAQLGDKALITSDGRLVGWIGGSCTQSVVRREAEAAIRSGRPRLLRLTAEPGVGETRAEGLATLPMTCPSGGEVEIYIEPHIQRPRVVAVGRTPVAQALARLAPVVGFDAMQVVGSADAGQGTEAVTLEDLDAGALDANAFVVVASAGHYDEEALAAALRTPVPYIGLVASRRRAAAVFTLLRASGCTEEQLARVRTPAGLAIGAVTQEEIALSILAEVVGVYRERQRALADTAPAPAAATPAVARDPVCGMEVEVAGARHTAAFEGVTYYFCCPHCRKHFLDQPARYVGAGS